MKKVAIQGITGSFHDIAARQYFESEDISIIPCVTFKDVVKAIREDSLVIGLMAIENTIAGSLLQNYELIRGSGCSIAGEYKLRVSHMLAALPGTTIEQITDINSHPIALMQCAEYLESLRNVRIVESEDTAWSARRIAENKLQGQAAICSRLAAEVFGLEVLAESVETNKHNFTRFLVITDTWNADDLLKNVRKNKSSIVFSLPHTSGSLSKVLTILSFYDMNLSKIQSLPIIGREWEYMFYVDFGFGDYTRYKQALDAIMPLTKDLKILGEYAEGKQNE